MLIEVGAGVFRSTGGDRFLDFVACTGFEMDADAAGVGEKLLLSGF